MADFVECRRQVRVQDPRPPRLAFQREVERPGRVLAAAPRPEPVTRASNRASHSGSSAFLTRAWWHAVHEHRNSERALLSVGLGDIHAPHRQGLPGPDGAVHFAAPSPSWPGRRARRPCRSPAVRRPALRWVTCRTLTSVLLHDRSIIFCRFLTFGQVTVPHRREDPPPQPRYVLLVGRPVHGVPLQPALRSVRRLRHLTCPSVRLAACLSPHRLTWLASAPFRAQHELRYPAGYHGPRPGGGRTALPAFSRRLSAAGFASRPSFPAWYSAPLTIGLPSARSRWTMTGFPRSAHARYGRIGRPLYPGTSGAHAGRVLSPARRLPHPSGRVLLPRLPSPIRGYAITRHQSRVHVVRPPGLPLARGPRMTRGPLRLSPGLRTHAGRTRARTPGRGQALSTSPELRRRPTSRRPSNLRVHSHRVRPRVALAGARPSALVVRAPRARSRSLWHAGSRSGTCRCGRGPGPGGGGCRWAGTRATRCGDHSRTWAPAPGRTVSSRPPGRVSVQARHQSGSPGGDGSRRAPGAPRGASAQPVRRDGRGGRAAGRSGARGAVAARRAAVMVRLIRAGSATRGGAGPPAAAGRGGRVWRSRGRWRCRRGR